MKVAIFDPFNGAGGDMIVASLLGLSLSENDLKSVVNSLNLSVEFEVKDVVLKGIKAKKVRVLPADQIGGSKTTRKFKEVLKILESSKIDPGVRKDVSAIFRILAEAEARVHGYANVLEATFHEVGSDDAIFDIVSAATGLRRLAEMGYTFYSTPVRLGSGFVEITHGKYPVPAPATVEILKNSSLEVMFGGEGELFTPTAAAILSYYCKGNLIYPFSVEGVYYGAGSRETEAPNLLRLILGSSYFHDSVVIIEANIDDVSGEIMGYAVSKLQNLDGVLDVFAVTGLGKKSRVSTLLRVIVEQERAEKVGGEIMKLTGTLGVRMIPIYHRMVSERQEEKIEVEIEGKKFYVRVKFSEPDFHHIKPEFDDVARIAEDLGLPIFQVYRKIVRVLEDADTKWK
jgi:hypothetical protein